MKDKVNLKLNTKKEQQVRIRFLVNILFIMRLTGIPK